MADLDGTTFLTGANAGFIAELYTRFLEHPDAVDESWRRFFSEMDDDLSAALMELRGPAWSKPAPLMIADGAEVDAEAVRQAAIDSIRALNLIRAYRVRGHLEADLDPLGLEKRGPYPELDYHSYGFTEADLDREIFINNVFGRERAHLARDRRDPARDLLRQDRRRVHAHPGAGRAGLDPAEIREAEPPGAVGLGQKGDPADPDHRRDLRAVSRSAVHRHQAVRHRGRGIVDAGARGDPATAAASSASASS